MNVGELKKGLEKYSDDQPVIFRAASGGLYSILWIWATDDMYSDNFVVLDEEDHTHA